MGAETLEALRGSIAKWEKIVAGTGEDRGTSNCPLCQLFHSIYRKDDKGSCVGCPVRDHSGEAQCDGTPYEDYCAAEEGGDEEAMEQAARAELDFLKSLLPIEARSDDEVTP